MKIIDILKEGKPSISFEVFPPKSNDTYDSVNDAVKQIARLSPSYMSVTYGAGGGNSAYSVSIAKSIKNDFGVTPLAHLTCINSSKEEIKNYVEELKINGIENVLALRGDITEENKDKIKFDYTHAYQLVETVKNSGSFCVGGACYPEGHPECDHLSDDIKNIKIKVDAGCDFLTTQMFFDNNIFYNYLYKLRDAGINCPVVAGIMPVTNGSQIKRICALCGTNLPQRFKTIVDRYGSNPEAMKQAGIAYATEQVIDLFANGINAVHIYSMNKPDVAEKIHNNISEIIK